MQDLEPYYNWQNHYIAAEDPQSPFFGRTYSEFYYTNTIYNYYIHPQWDDFGSETMYMKLLYVDYVQGYAIMEFIGEWNDAIGNDIMFLKRDIVEPLMQQGINKWILIGENVLNFHASDDCYYEEWFQECEDGWIAGINFLDHVIAEFAKNNIDYYIGFGGEFDDIPWRTYQPQQFFDKVNDIMNRRLGM